GHHHHAGAELCAFDMIEMDGEDLRRTRIEERKRTLAKLLGRFQPGIIVNEYFEDDGAIIYKHACTLGCEGFVSKRLVSPYAPAGRIFGYPGSLCVRTHQRHGSHRHHLHRLVTTGSAFEFDGGLDSECARSDFDLTCDRDGEA